MLNLLNTLDREKILKKDTLGVVTLQFIKLLTKQLGCDLDAENAVLTKAEIKLIESVHPITRNNDLSLNTRDSDQILPKN